MDGDVVRQVFAGLRLDVVDLVHPEILDRDDSLLPDVRHVLGVAEAERFEQTDLLRVADEADQLCKPRTLATNADHQLVDVVPVGALLELV